MMLQTLRTYIDGDMQVTEYSTDGVTVSHIVKVPVQTEQPITLDGIKQQKIKELQQSYYSSFTTFQSSATGTAKTYPIDAEAQKNLSDYQNRLIADPNKDAFYFKTIEDGTLILHNRQQFLQLMEDAEMFKVNQTIKYDDLVNQVNAATTTDEVDAVIW